MQVKRVSRTCKQCGKPFENSRPWVSHCSPDCADDYHESQLEYLPTPEEIEAACAEIRAEKIAAKAAEVHREAYLVGRQHTARTSMRRGRTGVVI